jgi:hypothetical protein
MGAFAFNEDEDRVFYIAEKFKPTSLSYFSEASSGDGSNPKVNGNLSI